MPVSVIDWENHFRLEQITKFIGLTDKPDETQETYPDPYHIDSLDHPRAAGLRLGAFGKSKPSDPNPAGLYEVQSNRLETDKLGNQTIKSGDYVVWFTLIQFLEQFGWDFGKGIDLQELGGFQMPQGDGSGFSTFGSLLEILMEILTLLSKQSKTVNGLEVSMIQSTLMQQSLLSGIGIPLTLQLIPYQIGEHTCYIHAPVAHPWAPSVVDQLFNIKMNVALGVGSNITLREVN